jgi:hypothetical protein
MRRALYNGLYTTGWIKGVVPHCRRVKEPLDFPIEQKRKTNETIDRLPLNEQDAAWDKFFAAHRHDVKRLALGSDSAQKR